MEGEFSFRGLPQIPNQVKTIGDLSGVGNCPASPFGITAVPVVALRLNRFFRTFVALWIHHISFIRLITGPLSVITFPEELG